MPGSRDGPPGEPNVTPPPRPLSTGVPVPRPVKFSGCIPAGPLPTGTIGSAWPPGARIVPSGPCGGKNEGLPGGGFADGGAGGAPLDNGCFGGAAGSLGFLAGGGRPFSSVFGPWPACERMRLLRKSPECCRRRISNLRNSTMVATAQRITSSKIKSRKRAIKQARIQCASDIRSNFML